jgi:glycosidase
MIVKDKIYDYKKTRIYNRKRQLSMKRMHPIYLALCMALTGFTGSTAQVKVNPLNRVKVNPLNWWVGMQNPELQLMLYAPGIGKMAPVLRPYAGVAVKAVHPVENGNYLFVDLLIGRETGPGTLHFDFKGNGRQYVLDYVLERKETTDGVSRILGVTDKDLVYLLMPDRFANGDTSNDVVKGMRDNRMNKDSLGWRHGGDLKGVEDHLDYLKDLGVTTVWMTPVLENDMPRSSYHGYAITDQYQVDSRFGGNEAYASLVRAAHAKGMKIIQDAVYNHIGSYHWTVLDQPMKDWLNRWPAYTNTSYRDQPLLDPYASAIDKKKTVDGWFVSSMPDLNQRNPYVQNYLVQYAIWATEYFGVDGWRVDTWFYSDKDFLNRINTALEREFPRLTFFGEVWVNTVAEAAYFCQNNLDVPYKPNLQGVVDFNVCFAIGDGLKNGDADKVYNTLAQDFLYKNPYRNCIMLDNHDMDRFFSTVDGDLDKYKMGMAWLMTLRGIPQLYYGDEVLMANKKTPTDAMVRMDFPGGWPGDTVNKFIETGRTEAENEAFRYIRSLALFRRQSSALTTGKLMQYLPENNVYTYFRYDDRQTVMVIANLGKDDQPVSMDRFSQRMGAFRSGKDVETGVVVGLQGLIVRAHQTMVLELMP